MRDNEPTVLMFSIRDENRDPYAFRPPTKKLYVPYKGWEQILETGAFDAGLMFPIRDENAI